MDKAYQLLNKIVEIIVNPVIFLMFAVALVVFLWGVAEFLRNSNDASSQEKGKSHILWGLIGMAIMVSAFAIIRVALGTFAIPTPSSINSVY
jgi:nitrogen fixation-related uncharacterized protein